MADLVSIKLSKYKPPAWHIGHVDLKFTLQNESTLVQSVLHVSPSNIFEDTLVLDGEELELKSISIDGKNLDEVQYSCTDTHLTILNLPEQAFTLELETCIYPEKNTRLEGLYLSSGNYCTQCEAEGFRRITYFLDRPDVLATYTTTIIADKTQQPVLLGNGNLVEKKDLADNQHQAVWHDPIPKPCYLFALVAGNLVSLDDTFTTMTAREVALHIYVEPHNAHLCDYAMQSLKEAMQWDEEKYGRAYDLDIFNIVAVDDFNMGAMENKSLNVFNSKCILADKQTASDTDFISIQAIVGHEYFHNWTGNRITCRDWFQLSLKEGLTVFRDQEFTGDFHSKAVKRIQDVRLLRTHQFAEDASPLSHPVRPEEYVEINNFYTLTVYEKGAEIIRMFYNFLGDLVWRKATDLYFERFDGQAVTVEDFLACVSEASGTDYSPMMRWYTQAGTPQVKASWVYDEAISGWQLTLQQYGKTKSYQPLLIPVKIAWVSALENTVSQVLHFDQTEQTFVFADVDRSTVPSLFQGFSAPIELHAEYTNAMLETLVRHDQDKFNQWKALQAWFANLVEEDKLSEVKVTQLALALQDLLQISDYGFLAEMLSLPTLNSLAEQQDILDIDGLHQRYTTLTHQIATILLPVLLERYPNIVAENDLSASSMATRKLQNNMLALMSYSESPVVLELAQKKYETAENMTDRMAALLTVLRMKLGGEISATLLDDFYQRYQGQNLVIDKWFGLQASADRPDTLRVVKSLLQHKDFNWKNPNRLRSVLSVFTQNLVYFHQEEGAGYRLIGQWVEKIDAVNPQVASRLCKSFSCLSKLSGKRKIALQAECDRLNGLSLSKDVTEILGLFKNDRVQ